MFSVYTTLSWRQLRRHWLRAALIVVTIALGVGLLVATWALNQAMSHAALRAANPLAGTADLIVSNGEAAISRSLEAELAQIPGVRAVWPRIFARVRLPDLENRPALLLGLELAEMRAKGEDPGPFEYSPNIAQKSAALLLGGNTPVIVGRELAEALPEKNGEVRVQSAARQKAFKLARAGTVDARGTAASLGGTVLILDLGSAAKIVGLKTGLVSRLDLILAPAANLAEVRQAVDQRLAGRGLVRTPEEQDQVSQSAMAAFQIGFAVGGVLALVLGLFLVYNVLAFTAAERRHEVGVLRSLGATGGQVRRLFAGEAGVLGLAGCLLGIPLGVGLAALGLRPVQDVLGDMVSTIGAHQITIGPGVVLVALGAGVCTAVAAALIPAIMSSREKPAEAVRRVPRSATRRYRALLAAPSGVLLVLGAACILGRGTLPDRLGTFGGLIFAFMGALAAIPLVAKDLGRVLQPLARRFLRTEDRLAADNLFRAPGRTGLVIAAFAAGVALVLLTSGIIRSNRQALHDWVRDNIPADLLVTSGSPVNAGGHSQTMDLSLGQELLRVPGIEAAVPLRFRKVDYGDSRVFLNAADAGGLYRADSKRPRPMTGVALYRQLSEQPGGAIVSENFAALRGIDRGGSVTLTSPTGPATFRVIGKLTDYTWNLGTILINRADYLKYWDDPVVDVFDVFLQRGQDVRAVQENILRKLGADHGLFVLTRDEFTARIDSMIERLYGVGYAQYIVVMLVAALGVVMALLISVLQRRRELALLRAVGASMGQVIRSVLVEAALMGFIGLALGLLIGVAMLWYVLKVLILEESGFLFPLHVPWIEGLVIAGASVLLATLAGLWPALSTVRQRIPEAIAYE
jgi:putative ABC transport system permease protein